MFCGFRWGLEITCLGTMLGFHAGGCRLRCGLLDLVLDAAPEMWGPGGIGVDRPSGSRAGYRSFQSEILNVVVMDCRGMPPE